MSKKETAVKATPTHAAFSGIELNDVVTRIAQSAYETSESKEGGIEDLPKDFYESTLPEGLDLATRKKFQDHDSFFLAGVAQGGGARALDRFKADPNLQNVSMDVKIGHDRLDLNFGRDGTVEGRWQVKGTGSAGSQYGKVRSHIGSLIKEQLGEKKD